jgi:hypothetical protein
VDEMAWRQVFSPFWRFMDFKESKIFIFLSFFSFQVKKSFR